MNGRPLLLSQVPPGPGSAPSAFTAVPTAMNSAMSEPNSLNSMSRRTPTIPSAPSAAASASIRLIASSRASYMAADSLVSSWFFDHRPSWMPTW